MDARRPTLRDKVVYTALAALIAAGLLVGVNTTINTQTDVLRELQRLGTQQLAQSRASDCTVALPLLAGGRDHADVNACYADQGLTVPYPDEPIGGTP